MGSRPQLSADVLGQIALMQSVIRGLPDKAAMLQFACQGLRDISGVEAVTPCSETAPHRDAEDTPFVRHFQIRRDNRVHACLSFSISDPAAFEPYVPYIENFAVMLSVIFEERRQQALNRSLMADLERRVSERTADLQREMEIRRKADEDLHLTQHAVNTVEESIFWVDETGRLSFVNDTACRRLGYSREELLSLAVFDVNPDFPQNAWQGIVARSSEKRVFTVEGGHRTKTGESFPVEETVTLVEYEGRQFCCVVARDVAERRKVQETLQRAAKLDALGLLAGGIAHDFNNLLSGVFGYIDLAIESASLEESVQYLSRSIDALDRARGLTHQLLTFAKGGVPRRSVGELFPEVEKAARFALSGSTVSLQCDVPYALRPCSFDKNQLGQVVENLVINAQQAMPDGGVIRISAEEIDLSETDRPLLPEGKYLRVSIRDNGVGIPAEILPRIFDPFYTTKAKGHGLGLATCYSIIRRHDGLIEAESVEGQGTVFHIYLPAAETEGNREEAAPAAAVVGTGTILVLDDEASIRHLLTAMLGAVGFRVVAASHAAEALALYSVEKNAGRALAAMIFDLTIPGGPGGKEVIQEIRRIDKDTPAFVASGYGESPVMAAPSQFGFTGSISKPFRKRELLAVLAPHIGTASD